MSGHSKFANIKHKKGRMDSQRGKIFTKIGREIVVAVKSGGPEPDINRRLRDVIVKAKAANMPSDTITRSIKRANGDLGDVDYETITYEGYGPSGTAVIVECLTENKNRTAANVRHAFSKFGGNMGTSGCVSFMFDKKGQILIDRETGLDEDELMMMALEAGAQDFNAEDELFEILTDPADFSVVFEAIAAKNIAMMSAEITMIPQTETDLEDEKDVINLQKMLDQLEDDDDVQNVWTNWGNQE